MKFAIQPLVALCVLGLDVPSALAQATPPRAAPPARMLTLPSRTTQPGATPYRPLTTAGLAPITSQAPSLQQPQQRAFNLDSAVARVLAEMKIVGMVGEIEMAVTNAGKVEITVFPLLVHVFDGQVRTEMDISAASALITATGPFSALRQVGLTKVINLTQLKGSAGVASQIFPEGNCYVTRDLPVDDLLVLMRMEKKPLGQEAIGGVACEKALLTLVYPSGQKRDAYLWSVGATPRQLQFDVGDSRLTVRVQDAQSVAELLAADMAEQKAALFELPKNYDKYTDLDSALTRIHARQQPAGAKPARAPAGRF